ncbi:uncharacterized protein [Struthio camelus]|uniref:uncharacterized protein n=1 Tax=Struthio camelus TaxID=8801 RepID=UPI0036042CA8
MGWQCSPATVRFVAAVQRELLPSPGRGVCKRGGGLPGAPLPLPSGLGGTCRSDVGRWERQIDLRPVWDHRKSSRQELLSGEALPGGRREALPARWCSPSNGQAWLGRRTTALRAQPGPYPWPLVGSQTSGLPLRQSKVGDKAFHSQNVSGKQAVSPRETEQDCLRYAPSCLRCPSSVTPLELVIVHQCSLVSLASTGAWELQHGPQTSQPCSKQAMSTAGSSGTDAETELHQG